MLFKLLSDRNQIMQYNTCAMRASYIKAQSGIIIVTIQPDILIYSKSVLCLLTTQLKQLIFVGHLFPQKPTSSVLLLNLYFHYPQACLWIKMLQIKGNINTSLSSARLAELPSRLSSKSLKMPGSAESPVALNKTESLKIEVYCIILVNGTDNLGIQFQCLCRVFCSIFLDVWSDFRQGPVL